MISKKTAVDIGLFVVSNVILYYGFRWALGQMDPMRKKKQESSVKAKQLFERMKLSPMELNDYEQIIAAEIIHPNDIQSKFEDIGGLDDILETLQEAVIYPLTMPEDAYGSNKSANQLVGPPKGVLLYGPPGCGKTLIAQALAKESGAVFINLHVSTLTEKWYGESQKLVRAVFSLARKLQPSIVFIDEIDSFLRERQSSDHEVTGMMKAEFMSLWDGLSSTSADRIMILGATNRYSDIDKAILRRMPKRFPVNLPDQQQRMKILEILLKGIEIEKRKNCIEKAAKATAGYSGSDLKELCRNAVMMPVREMMRKAKADNPQVDLSKLAHEMKPKRAVRLNDFITHLEPVNKKFVDALD